MRLTQGLVLGVVLIAGSSCGGADSVSGTGTSNNMSLTASTYLNAALDVMQANSFYRAKIDWTKLRAAAIAGARGAQSSVDTYASIRTALIALGDHHSFLQPPVAGANVAPAQPLGWNARATMASMHISDSLDGEIVGGRYGYIRVPTFAPVNGGSAAQSSALADTLQGLVRAVDAKAPCGWIVDLRHNMGGNMWPMLAGIGPVIGEGTELGSFLSSTGASTSWYYSAGVAGTKFGAQTSPVASVSRAPYTLRSANPPVAVLTDGLTASSGEAITVAFRGRPGTRSFWTATYGVPTANSGFRLSDGAEIWLMVAVDVDRAGTQYVDPIVPDQIIGGPANPSTDDVVVVGATAWLIAQPGCLVQGAVR